MFSPGCSCCMVRSSVVLDIAGVVLGETYGGRMCALLSDENALPCAKWITWIFRPFCKVCDK